METEVRLQLVFNTSNNKTYSLYIDDPKEPVDPIVVKAAMVELVNTNIIGSKNGDLVSIKEANVISRSVTPVDLEG